MVVLKNNSFKIGNRLISKDNKPFVIAEVGINHGGDIEKAKQMILDAYNAGAECVKFQLHIINDEMSTVAKKVIPEHTKESIWDIMSECALSIEDHKVLKKICDTMGIMYLCTPFSRAAADELIKMDIPGFKIGSGECNNYPLLKHIASFGKPIILSTGMNNLESVRKAVDIFEEANIDYALLHCTSLYPTPYSKIRLGAMQELMIEFPDSIIGLSDHSVGNFACYGAVALGARIIEKHFTSDKNWPGPDIALSVDTIGLKDLIDGCNFTFLSLGGSKEILKEEQSTIDFAYASVVTIADVKKGEKFTRENLWVKRPGKDGIKAERFEDILGLCASKNLNNDTILTESDFE